MDRLPAEGVRGEGEEGQGERAAAAAAPARQRSSIRYSSPPTAPARPNSSPSAPPVTASVAGGALLPSAPQGPIFLSGAPSLGAGTHGAGTPVFATATTPRDGYVVSPGRPRRYGSPSGNLVAEKGLVVGMSDASHVDNVAGGLRMPPAMVGVGYGAGQLVAAPSLPVLSSVPETSVVKGIVMEGKSVPL